MAEKNTAPAGAGGTQSADPDADAGDCVTRITYGSAWIRSANHVDTWDEASGLVTWDGSCQIDVGLAVVAITTLALTVSRLLPDC
jgi:hypothetical protein